MGEAIITRRYSSLGLSETAYAIISVSYPQGWVCTCADKKGNFFFTARDLSGEGFFNIPESGEWTVTAVNPTNPSEKLSKTENINQTMIYRITLSIGLEVFSSSSGAQYPVVIMTAEGLESEGNGGAWMASGVIHPADENDNQNYHYIEMKECSYARTIVYFNHRFKGSELSGYSKLTFSGQQSYTTGESGGILSLLKVGLVAENKLPTNTSDPVEFVCSNTFETPETYATINIPLENISSNTYYYVVINGHDRAPGIIDAINFS